MLFSSYEYIFFFLPIVFIGYFFLNHKRFTEGAKFFLILSSLFFYSWWDIKYLPILLLSMGINYILGVFFQSNINTKKSFSRKSILYFGIIFNISLLGYFKYVDFFIENLNYFYSEGFDLLKLTLPLAISFFTFQQIAYLVDSYNNKIEKQEFLNYALFVSFFPQLIAGPIVHHKEMMPQFSYLKTKIINQKNILLGTFIFLIGLFKKVVIADTFAVWANNGFDNLEVLTFFEAWVTSLSYTFQLYFDFSGYSDMAIGVALLFNIKLPMNFNKPYLSTTIQEFWHRWHMTLSRFLKDYIYVPLGGNRLGKFSTYKNLMITFIIGGIWHGAGWTFIIWGALHGTALIVHRIWQSINIRLNNIIAWFITFNFINITWVFFRANDVETAIRIIKSMFDFKELVSLNNIDLLILWKELLYLPIQKYVYDYNIFFNEFITKSIGWGYIFILIGFCLIFVNVDKYMKSRNFIIGGIIFLTLIIGLSSMYLNIRESHEFLYFQF